MTRPVDRAAQLASYRAFMDLLRAKAVTLVLAEQQGQPSPKRSPRAEAGTERQAPHA